MIGSSDKLVMAAIALVAASACASDSAPAREGDDTGMENQNSTGSTAGTGSSAGTSGGTAGGGGGTIREPGANAGSGGAGGTGATAGMSAAAGSGGAGMSGSGEDVDCSQLPLPENSDDIISTFEDGTGATQQVAGRGGGFYMFNDMTGTQDPPTGALPPARMMERCGGQYALCMSGSGFTEWGAGMGTDLGMLMEMMKQSVDLSEYSGIAFWARTVSGTPLVRVSLKDKNTAPEGGVCDESVTSGEGACNDDWGKQLNLTPEWQPYTLLFSDLRQAGWGAAFEAFDESAVYSIQWQVGPNLEFDLCIDDLMLVR